MRTYQNFIYVTNTYMSRKTGGRETGKNNQGTTRTNKIKRKTIISIQKIAKKIISTRRKWEKNNMKTTSQKT